MTTKEMSDFLNNLWCWARCTEEEQRKLSEIADYLSSRGNEKNDCISRIETIDYLCKHCPDDGECFKDCDEIKHLRQMPSVTPQEPRKITLEDVKEYCKPRCLTIISNKLLYELTHPKIKALKQEPQSFKWCTDCKEYDQEKHCCHRWSKVIRDTVAEIRQETILDKLRAEIENINVWAMRYEPDEYLDQRPQIVQKVKGHVIEIIDKYKAESEKYHDR